MTEQRPRPALPLLRPVLDTALLLAAVAVTLALTFPTGADLFELTLLDVVALAIVPVLIRFGMVLESRTGTLRVSTAAAILFAHPGPAAADGFTLLWSVVVLVSHLVFSGPSRGVGRGSVEVLAGTMMVVVADQVASPLWPLDRALLGTAVYLLTVLLLELARYGLLDLRRSLRGVRAADVLLIAGGLTLASSVVMLLWESTDADLSPASVTAAGLLVALVGAQILFARLQTMARGIEVLSRAGSAMPWPGDEVERMLVRFIREGVRARDVRVGATPTSDDSLTVDLTGAERVTATRVRGDYPFTRGDRRLISALAGMADASRAHALQEQQLRHQATTDGLTGLHTYAHFRHRIDRLGPGRSSTSKVAAYFVDLDGFKSLNTTIGHLATDQVLCTIAERIKDLPEHVESCRFGGDEFVFVAAGIGDDVDVQALAARIRAAVESPLESGDQLIQVRASLGSATSDDPAEQLDDVLQRAESRMREAKRERQIPLMKSRADLIDQLLGPDGFTVAYQPLVSVQDGELEGVEALIRVWDKTFGQLSPLLVVDAALRDDLIDDLTEKLALQAAEVVAELGTVLGRPVTLTVNIEFSQLREDSRLMDTFVAIAERNTVSLVLELSERAFDTWTETHQRLATRLSRAGVSLAIDDFGAGYATFSLLNQWPWDLIKVDRSLVAGTNPAERRLFTHVASMLDDLGLATIAEGIETYEQLVLVAQLGIEWAQGWWVSPPLTEEQLLSSAARSSRFPVFEGVRRSG